MTRQAVSKHLGILEEANLVATVRRGREKLHYLNPVPIHEIGERWIGKFESHRLQALSDLKKALETELGESTMSKPVFVYVSYIASTPDKVFKALTDDRGYRQVLVRQRRHVRLEGRLAHHIPPRGQADHPGQVLEYDPPRRLSYTFTAACTSRLMAARSPRAWSSRLEQQRDQVKLTVTHDDFAPDSKVFASISNGWPLVLSSLKSYLETGRVLHAPWYDKEKVAS